jgi:cell division FtsZ-interacting protein ZapD
LLAPLRTNPAIEPRVLEPLLAEIDSVSQSLLAQAGKAGTHLRDNDG